MAGWLKKQRFDARVMCRSSKSAWRASRRFKSTFRKCVWRMSVILTMHETNTGGTLSNVTERKVHVNVAARQLPVEKCSRKTTRVEVVPIARPSHSCDTKGSVGSTQGTRGQDTSVKERR